MVIIFNSYFIFVKFEIFLVIFVLFSFIIIVRYSYFIGYLIFSVSGYLCIYRNTYFMKTKKKLIIQLRI